MFGIFVIPKQLRVQPKSLLLPTIKIGSPETMGGLVAEPDSVKGLTLLPATFKKTAAVKMTRLSTVLGERRHGNRRTSILTER